MRKLTTEEFIERARVKHGDRYSYELVEYLGTHIKVKITCKKHGVFEQTPNNHLTGRGCIVCCARTRLTTSVFIKRAKSIHGETYDYSGVEYVSARKNVKIICKKHGVFEQAPYSHFSGKGCGVCGSARSSSKLSMGSDIFIERATQVHSSKYDYSSVEYLNINIKVKIKCKDHGLFKQSPDKHLNGQGCPSCEFNRDQPTDLYMLTNGQKVKIGISCRFLDRFREMQRSAPFAIEHTKSWALPDFSTAYELEQRIHKRLAHLNAQYSGFDGATEWFEVSPAVAIKEINKVVNNSRQLALI